MRAHAYTLLLTDLSSQDQSSLLSSDQAAQALLSAATERNTSVAYRVSPSGRVPRVRPVVTLRLRSGSNNGPSAEVID